MNDTFKVSPVHIFCQKILPAVFDDSLSYYEQICKFVEKLNEVIGELNKVDTETLQEQIDELNKEFEKFKESGFDDYYAAQIEQWISDNLLLLWKTFAKQVFFGLTSDGYFCAYVPDSWSDITFDTGAVYGRNDYGRLILRYDADGSGIIDNTHGYYSDNEYIKQLQIDVERLNKTAYTPVTEVDNVD